MTAHQSKMFRLLLTGVVVALNVLPVSAADIVLQKVVAPKSTVVRLGDVAKVKSNDGKEVERLATIPLMASPAPGRTRFIRMREIQDLLAAHGEDMNALDFSGELMVEIAPAVAADPTTAPRVDRRAVWAGTSTVVPTSASVVANPAAAKRPEVRLTDVQALEAENYIKRAVVEHLNHNTGRRLDWQLAITVAPADLVKVLDAKTALQCSGGVSPWTGNQRMVVAFSTERGPVRVRLEADVTVAQTVVVATRPIERGSVITAADVAIEEISELPKETLLRKPIESLEGVIGLEATKAIREGDTIYTGDFRPQLLVKRGEEIAVYARGGGIQVRTIARARQDGARGELIGVESLGDKEPFEAVVTGPREAVVFTPSTTGERETVAEQPFRRMREK
jgi:flagella basal body P-ring formation protein FlgA